jgi:hypothetical protein
MAPAGALSGIVAPEGVGVPKDLDENVVRKVGLARDFVDIEVCAVDETRSGAQARRATRPPRAMEARSACPCLVCTTLPHTQRCRGSV